MQDGIHPHRLARSGRAPLLAAVLVSVVLVTGCGGSSGSLTAATVGGASTPASSASHATTPVSSTATGGGTTSSRPTAPDTGPPNALAFAKCMRANGVPNFPDPPRRRGVPLQYGWNQSRSARVPGGTGEVSQVRAQSARRRRVEQLATGDGARASAAAQSCAVHAPARYLGLPRPDDHAPVHPFDSGPGLFTDYDGVFLFLPATIDLQSPAWEQAGAACGPLAESFNHPHRCKQESTRAARRATPRCPPATACARAGAAPHRQRVVAIILGTRSCYRGLVWPPGSDARREALAWSPRPCFSACSSAPTGISSRAAPHPPCAARETA